MTATAPKRGRGRPRNAALDSLAEELAVSRRRASSVLKEAKNSTASTSENSANSLSPLAAARLEKLTKEIRFLETRIKTAEMEQEILDLDTIRADVAKKMLSAALEPIVATLRTWPKSLPSRLVGMPSRMVESILADAVSQLLTNARQNLNRFNAALEK